VIASPWTGSGVPPPRHCTPRHKSTCARQDQTLTPHYVMAPASRQTPSQGVQQALQPLCGRLARLRLCQDPTPHHNRDWNTRLGKAYLSRATREGIAPAPRMTLMVLASAVMLWSVHTARPRTCVRRHSSAGNLSRPEGQTVYKFARATRREGGRAGEMDASEYQNHVVRVAVTIILTTTSQSSSPSRRGC
jgi:hypothetical protein